MLGDPLSEFFFHSKFDTFQLAFSSKSGELLRCHAYRSEQIRRHGAVKRDATLSKQSQRKLSVKRKEKFTAPAVKSYGGRSMKLNGAAPHQCMHLPFML